MLNQILSEWAASGQISQRMANKVYEDLDSIMKEELENIANLTKAKQEETALTALMQLTSTVNAAAQQQPKIITKLNNWIGQIKATVYALAQQLGANSISISAGVPLGVSVGLSWPVP